MKSYTKQIGFGLIELVVAMFVSSLLLMGLFQVFQGGRMAYDAQESLSRIQENSRFALYLMSQDLRMAGLRGCDSDVNVENVLNDPNAFVFDMNTPLQAISGTPGGFVPGLPGDVVFAPEPAANSDILVVRAVTPSNGFRIGKAQDQGKGAVHYWAQPGVENTLSRGDIVMISDCKDASVAQINYPASPNPAMIGFNPALGAGLTPGNATMPQPYDPGAEIYTVSTLIYYVGLNPDNVPALFVSNNGRPADEIAVGIERLRLRFGRAASRVNDLNNPPPVVDYVTPDQVRWTVGGMEPIPREWVSTVRVSLLVRGEQDNVTDEPQEIRFVDEEFVADDHRLRMVAGTTIALRNPLTSD